MRMRSHLALIFASMLLFAGHAFGADAKNDQPEPQAPVKAAVEDGRVMVFVGTTRVSAYHIGDSIPVRIVFELTPDAIYKAEHAPRPAVNILPVQATAPANTNTEADTAKPKPPEFLTMPLIDVENLRMGVLTNQPTDAEMLTNAVVARYTKPDGRLMVVVDFTVSTYVTTQKTQIGIAADYMYAVTKLPDGQPAFQSATTPEMIVGITKSATDNQTLLIEGDLSVKDSPHAPAALYMLVLSPVFALPMLISLALIGLSLIRRERDLSKNELTWRIFDAVISDAERRGGFTLEHYRRLFHALRAHFDVLGLDTTQTLSLLNAREGIDGAAVDTVFNRETVFFDPDTTISSKQHEKLMTAIAVLVPRH